MTAGMLDVLDGHASSELVPTAAARRARLPATAADAILYGGSAAVGRAPGGARADRRAAPRQRPLLFPLRPQARSRLEDRALAARGPRDASDRGPRSRTRAPRAGRCVDGRFEAPMAARPTTLGPARLGAAPGSLPAPAEWGTTRARSLRPSASPL